MKRRLNALAAVALVAALCVGAAGVAAAPDPYVVELDVVLSKKKGKKPKGGVVKIEVHPDWAPIGAERFKTIVKSGIWEWNRFFRCAVSAAVKASTVASVPLLASRGVDTSDVRL